MLPGSAGKRLLDTRGVDIETIDGRMEMLKYLLALIASAIVVIAGSLTATAGEKEAAMDAIYVPVGRLALAPPVGVVSKRAAVAFPHSRHFEYTCRTCHHKWDGQSNVKRCSAADCHDQLSAPPPVKGARYFDYISDSIGYFKFAFHRQCINCHKEIEVRNAESARSVFKLSTPPRKTGPTGCVQCHPRG